MSKTNDAYRLLKVFWNRRNDVLKVLINSEEPMSQTAIIIKLNVGQKKDQSQVSQMLRECIKVGLVKKQRMWKSMYYSLRLETIEKCANAIKLI